MKLFEDKDKERLERRRGAKVRHLDARKGGTMHLKDGSYRQGGGGGKERRREVFWFLKKWNHYNSRWTANGTGVGGEDRWREVFWFLKNWNHYNSRRTANCRGWGG